MDILYIPSMEIDLELPSGQEDKLEAASETNFNIGSHGNYPGPEDAKSIAASRFAESNPEVCMDVNIIRIGDGLGVDSIIVEDANKIVAHYEPQEGLEFETKEAAYAFYREYARSVGFGITIKASRRSKKSGKFIDIKIACSRFGSKRESSATPNSRSCPKTDCKASMHMKRKQDGRWFIYSFVKEHNHEICPDDFYCSTRERGKQSDNVACQKKGLQLALGEEDVEVLLQTFGLMQAETPGFWYAIEFDDEKLMRRVFWVDAKGKHDYNNFCDVVFFDTYYVRNKYKTPFVPIVGVNNHFQFLLLGCALVGEETTSTFIWLMRTWLQAVGGQTPRMVITDEEKSIEEAVRDVFPDTCHCFGLWNVLQKIPENLTQIYDQMQNFMIKFKKCIFRSWTEEEFERRWWKTVNNFELREHNWIQRLYDSRRKWVPTYLRDTFMGGFCTAERCASICSFFDKYIHKEATLKELIDQYKAFCCDRYEDEAKADAETWQKQPILRSHSPFEKQMSTVYTHAIFEKFQVEVLGTVACNLQKECEDGTTTVFHVDDFEARQNFTVSWNETESDIHCLCHSFEYKGFLCRHAISVLQMCGVSRIPSNYILKRWTKEAKDGTGVNGFKDRIHSRVLRFNDLCKLAIRLGEEGSLSQETYDIAFCALEAAFKHCVGMNNSVRNVLEPNMLVTQCLTNIDKESQGNNITRVSKKRKVQKRQKVQTETKVESIGSQDSSGHMEQLNLIAHNLDNSYVPPENMQRMGQLNSVSTLRDGCHSNQQSLLGLGQLNPIPTNICHYHPQQSLQGLGHLPFRAPSMHGSFNIEEGFSEMEQSVNIGSKHLHYKHRSR